MPIQVGIVDDADVRGGARLEGLEIRIEGVDNHVEDGGQIGCAISDGAQRVATGDKATSPLYTGALLTATLPRATPFALNVYSACSFLGPCCTSRLIRAAAEDSYSKLKRGASG